MTRNTWVIVHRFAGLFIAFFVIVTGLTGSVLAFHTELDAWLNPPHLERVAVRAQPMLDEFTLRDKALSLIPQARINGMVLHREPGQVFVAALTPRTDPLTGKPYVLGFNTLMLDPYTGAEISRETRAVHDPAHVPWPITRHNVIEFIDKLHFRLAVPGQIGNELFGIAALVWTIDSFVALYLTFPISVRRQGAGHGMGAPVPRRSWWRRWRPSWLVKWRGTLFRVSFDLHRAAGLWVCGILLVFAWSSVGLNLPFLYEGVMDVFHVPSVLFVAAPALPRPRPDPALHWWDAHAIARHLMAEQAVAYRFAVLQEKSLAYDASTGTFMYSVISDRDLDPQHLLTWVRFDGDTGRFMDVWVPTGQRTGTTITNWIFALHLATVGGIPYQAFVCLLGLVATMVSMTGVYIWWKKFEARRRSRPATRRAS